MKDWTSVIKASVYRARKMIQNIGNDNNCNCDEGKIENIIRVL